MLEKYKKDLIVCTRDCRCAFCREDCPAIEHLGFESYSARGRNDIALAILEGQLEVTDPLVEVVFSCPTCGYCFERCGAEVPTFRITEALRADIMRAGKGLKKHYGFGESIKKNKNPYYEPHANRFAWLYPAIETTHNTRVIYYVGCTSAYREQGIARSSVAVLRKAGVRFIVLGGDEYCCGSPLIRTGQREIAEELAKHNVDALNKTKAEKIVVSCAGCYRTLKQDYPEEFGLTINPEILHMTAFIEHLIDESKLEFSKKLEANVTYHDPCHLGRHAKLYEPPRQLLKRIPGIKLVEMEKNRELAKCCGAGGGVKSGFHELALKMATNRIKSAEETGADILSSACPFCRRNLEDGVKSSRSKINVRDVCELVAHAL